MSGLEPVAERAIRAAQQRGEFDDLPGAGRPLDLGDPDDPHWWVKAFIRREGLDLADALPPTLALRREADGFPRSLTGLDDDRPRGALEGYNARVRRELLRPPVGPTMPVVAHTVDVPAMLQRHRDARLAAALAPEQGGDAAPGVPPRPSTAFSQPATGGLPAWWRRLVPWKRGR